MRTIASSYKQKLDAFAHLRYVFVRQGSSLLLLKGTLSRPGPLTPLLETFVGERGDTVALLLVIPP